jgi:hypothetical protein
MLQTGFPERDRETWKATFEMVGCMEATQSQLMPWLVKTKPPLNKAPASPWRLNFLPRCKMQGHHRGTVDFLQNGQPAKHLSMNWVYSRFLPSCVFSPWSFLITTNIAVIHFQLTTINCGIWNNP